MEYISEIIGEEYKWWEPGQFVFITAPTGTGKTTFILNQLVSFAAHSKKKVLYLVNRKILKKQLEENISNIVWSCLRRDNMNNDIPSDVIRIETYQSIEKMIQDYRDTPYYNQFDYIVADEAHYFYHDATYNTSTILSYIWIINKLNNWHKPIFIFISATMDKIKKRIKSDICRRGVYSDIEKKINF